MNKSELNEFVDSCISCGKCVETTFKLSNEEILEIEDILHRFNDKSAKTKIRKIVSKTK